MKIDYEKFTEKALLVGMADEFESKLYKSLQSDVMKRIDQLTEELYSSLDSQQRALCEKINELEIENESLVEKQAFYKGYMLARSFCAD